MSGDYGGDHEAIRRANLPYAYGTPCGRCGRPMLPGQPLDLDHNDDRTGYRGFAHARCNRSAGGRLGAQRRYARQRARRDGVRKTMLTEVVLGVEIAEDRRHTSIAAAGELPDEMVLVDLLAYLDGTDAVPTLKQIAAERTVLAIVIDPHSPAATLIRAAKDAGLWLTEPNASDAVVAHGEFLDLLAAGRLRHAGRPELDAAVRHGAQRPLAGAVTWARRGFSVDVAPLTAATLAVWGLRTVPRNVPWVIWK